MLAVIQIVYRSRKLKIELIKVIWSYPLQMEIILSFLYGVTELVGTPGHLHLSVAAILPLLAQINTSSIWCWRKICVHSCLWCWFSLPTNFYDVIQYCNSYCWECIRVPEAVRGDAQLNTAVKESKVLKIVWKIIITCPVSAMADTLLLLHSRKWCAEALSMGWWLVFWLASTLGHAMK